MSLDAIGIVSKNIEESIRFYGILGVTLKETGSPEHFEGVTSGGVRIMIDSENLMKKINPDWVEAVSGGIILCFKQKSSADVDALYDCIIKSGYDGIKVPWDAFWGQRYASVRDPNGNQIDVFAPLNDKSK